MKSFIKPDFLLENKYAEELYFDYASKMPIIDYHCHLSPKDIANDRVFNNLTEVWINGDHYKWRAMRTIGVDENYITGDAPDEEKFQQWAKTVPYTMRNPLYHWTHLELERYYGIKELLNPDSAKEIYQEAGNQLQQTGNSCRGLLTQMNVDVVCTTEDPTDTLEYHQQIAKSDFKTQISTSFRPDKAILIENDGYIDYIERLSQVSGITITSYQDLCDALARRIAYFNENGCKVSDHGLAKIDFESYTASEIDAIFSKKIAGKEISELDALKFHTALLTFLAESYHSFDWVQQFHLGALRNNNDRMHRILGPDTGWDSIGDYPQAENLSKFLNALDSKDKLTKTILYNLNPADNEVLATMVGNYNDGKIKGKMQFGSGWWFLDQKDGMIKQINALSNMGLLSCFVGMLTDSRSFMSYPRHEYFRRILCNLLGTEIEKGELPADMKWIGNMVSDICYNNAKEYFKF
ncbi:MAG: glucuronate isomerase [Flavobacteriaceae bacterium]|nr:MAG: glucuronate isomerase [Flavobacteriaceae bacterium]